jgi:hypothetical protein
MPMRHALAEPMDDSLLGAAAASRETSTPEPLPVCSWVLENHIELFVRSQLRPIWLGSQWAPLHVSFCEKSPDSLGTVTPR